MPVYNEDNRSPCQYHATCTSGGVVRSDVTVTEPKGNGTVHYFNGPREGKFIPGVYRVNDMQAYRATYVYGNGTAKSETKGTSYDIYVCDGPYGCKTGFRAQGSQSWDAGIMGTAVQKAHSRLLSTDLDVGEFLAELPSTISMVRKGVVSIQRAIRNAVHGGFTWEKANRARLALLSGKTIKSLPRRVSDSWLTWRYGIRPLIWDVQGFIREANSFASQSNFSGLRRVRGRVGGVSEDTSYQYPLYAYFAALRGTAKEYVEKTVKGEAVVYYSYGADFGPIQNILLKYGLNPSQFPYLLWQLVPLSFMVDWFVDVGTWVKAITPKWNITIHGCSASQKTSIRAVRVTTPDNFQSWMDRSDSTLVDRYVYEGIIRRQQTLSGEFPRRVPKVVLSIQQQADLLAVLLQRALSNRRL